MSAVPLRYPGATRAAAPDKAAVVMAGSGERMSFAELDDFAWQGARAFRGLGLQPRDNVAYMIENRLECPAVQWSAHYAGLYYTFISTRLTPDEVAYIAEDCRARVVVVTAATADRTVQRLTALASAPLVLSLGEPVVGLQRLESLMAEQPAEPLPGAVEGGDMLRDELPREPTGKLLKRKLRDEYAATPRLTAPP